MCVLQRAEKRGGGGEKENTQSFCMPNEVRTGTRKEAFLVFSATVTSWDGKSKRNEAKETVPVLI